MTSDRRRQINDVKIDTLSEGLRGDVHSVLSQLEAEGWYPMVTQALRTPQEQAAIYAQGRQRTFAVNNLRALAGLDPIEDSDNKIISYAAPGHSNHESGHAIDIINYEDGKEAEYENMNFYNRANELFAALGWIWGHNFKSFQDDAHYEHD